MPDPDLEDPKEVYAHFGLAVYRAQGMAEGLINLAVALRLTGMTGITRGVVEKLCETFGGRTLGQLLREVSQFLVLPDRLQPLLKDALARRNGLVHGFFRRHDTAFMTDRGRLFMFQELKEAGEKCFETDNAVGPIYFAVAKQFGISREATDAEFARLCARVGVDGARKGICQHLRSLLPNPVSAGKRRTTYDRTRSVNAGGQSS